MTEDVFINIDRELAGLVCRLAGREEDSLLGRTVMELSAVMRSGAVCMEISDPAVKEELLAAEQVVGRYPEEGLAKILLLENDLLYFQKMLLEELALARMFLNFPPKENWSEEKKREADQFVTDLFEKFSPSPAVERQKLAVRKTLENPLSIICGGPGTGKTTVGSAVLYAARQILNIAAEDMVILAPTGKAHMRLRGSLAGDSLLFNIPEEERGFFQEISGGTIHKILRWKNKGFFYNKDCRLPYKLILVDECSMISQELMKNLLSAIAPDTRLILLGDDAQLASVEPGNVFSNLCAAAEKAPADGPLYDVLTALTDNFRAQHAPELVAFAEALRAGTLLETSMIAAAPAPERVREEMDKLIGVYKETAQLCRKKENISRAQELLEKFKIICAVNGAGFYGVAGVNEMVLSLLDLKSDSPGVPVMIRHNDYALELFNGDVGVIGPDRLVYFPGHPDPIVLDALPEYDIAYAITAHKSQGSGYNEILLILPPEEMPLLTRSLIYTAVTRARQKALIWGDAEKIKELVKMPLLRSSGLVSKLLH